MATPTSTTFSTSTSTYPTAATSQVTDPAFYGYTSIEILADESTLFSSVDCNAGSTFAVASGYLVDHANCCAGACPVYTTCPSSTLIVAAGTSQTCTGSSTCVIDTIVGAGVTHAIYCGVGFGGQWYRSLPTNGITNANTSAINDANKATTSQMSTWKIITIAASLIFILGIAGILLLCCCCCEGIRKGGAPIATGPSMTKKETRRQARRRREKENAEEMNRSIQEARDDAAALNRDRMLQGY